MKNIFLPALLALACFYAHAQVGSPDPSFGKNGRQLAGSNTNTLAESAIKILPLQGGGFYIVINGDGGTLTDTRTALVGQYKQMVL